MSTPIVDPGNLEQDPGAENEPTVEETDWKAKFEDAQKHSRTWEQRAKDNKAAADKLAAFEESQKTAEQKAADRLAEAERLTAEANAKLVRRDVALEHKLTATDAALLDTITDEAAMRSLAARLAPAEGPRAPRPDLNQGKPGTAVGTPGDEFAAFLQGQLGQ